MLFTTRLMMISMILFAMIQPMDNWAYAGPIDRAKDAVDPDCTVAKAAKGAARKAVIGIGNRCDVAETARDVTGVDGKGKEAKQRAADRDRKRKDD